MLSFRLPASRLRRLVEPNDMDLRLRAFALLLCAGMVSPSCTYRYGPGPFYACSPSLSGNWEIQGGRSYCTCDLDNPPPPEPQRIRLLSHAWYVEIVAPAGSFAPGTAVGGEVDGHPISGLAAQDGSVVATAQWTLPARQDPGPSPTRATLSVGDQRFRVWFPGEVAPGRPRPERHGIVSAGDDRFPEGAWAIEDPPGTMDIRIRAEGAELVGVGGNFGPRLWSEVEDSGVVATTFPGRAGDRISVRALWPDHTATCGSYAESFCHCSRATLASSSCDTSLYPWFAEYGTAGAAISELTDYWDWTPPGTHDAGTDAGVDAGTDAAPEDASYRDANLPDADGGGPM